MTFIENISQEICGIFSTLRPKFQKVAKVARKVAGHFLFEKVASCSNFCSKVASLATKVAAWQACC